MRTTLVIDDDVLAAARRLAADRGEAIGKVISELARRGLRPAYPSHAHGGAGELPVFEVRENAPLITPDMVRRALEDD